MRATPADNFAHHDPSTSCSSTSNLLAHNSNAASSTCPREHHIVTGTFNSPDLFVLTYDSLSASLSLTHTIPAEGPHQYLALGLSSTHQQTVYATTWGSPSTLSSWHVSPQDYTLSFGNRKEITATGSYVHVQPPPYYTNTSPGFGSAPGVGRWLGSAGGPTGELHRLNAVTGLIEDRTKEIIFLPGGEAELRTADKSRKALRYGAHSFDCSRSSSNGEEQVAFVADLGANAIQAYRFPSLDHLYTIPSKREGDGPRHVIPHPTEAVVFTVTEHSNYVDAYQVPAYTSDQTTVRHAGEADLLTRSQADTGRHNWRGDTLRFSSNLDYIYATTRGKTTATKGLLIAYRLSIHRDGVGEMQVDLDEVARFETRTSGGKANAIELSTSPLEDGVDTMVLTDDEQGWIDVVSFDLTSETFEVKASAQLPPLNEGEAQGASHAIWLL